MDQVSNRSYSHKNEKQKDQNVFKKQCSRLESREHESTYLAKKKVQKVEENTLMDLMVIKEVEMEDPGVSFMMVLKTAVDREERWRWRATIDVGSK